MTDKQSNLPPKVDDVGEAINWTDDDIEELSTISDAALAEMMADATKYEFLHELLTATNE